MVEAKRPRGQPGQRAMQQQMSNFATFIVDAGEKTLLSTVNLEEKVKQIFIPYNCLEAGMKFKAQLRSFAAGLRKFCQKTIGSLTSSNYLNPRQGSKWLKIVFNSLESYKKSFAKYQSSCVELVAQIS